MGLPRPIIMSRSSQRESVTLRKLILTAIFLAVALILPVITGGISLIGNMLLPMHYPVILCGMICGWPWGLVCGVLAPLLRSVIFGMPVFYPTALAMAFELATYGAVCGLLIKRLGLGIGSIYLSLVSGMVAGRLVWGLVSMILYGVQASAFTLDIFLAGAFLNAVPGIVLQLVLIPLIMAALKRSRTVPLNLKGESL